MSEAATVNLLLFQVGARRFGADAAEVKRVERSRPGDGRLATLGALSAGERALVFEAEGNEQRLQVDAVLGLALVELEALRRIPQSAAPRPYAVGLWLDEDPVLLLELAKTVPDLEARK
jgi:chemotaxis signal transduction protein